MKYVAYIVLSILVLLVVSIGLLPTFFSTEAGKKVFLSMMTKKSGLNLSIDKLSLSWFGTQDAQGITAEKSQTYEITCNEIQVSASLCSLIFKHDFKSVKLDSPSIKLYGNFQTADVTPTYLQKAGFIPQLPLAIALSPNFNGTINVNNGIIEIVSPGIDPIFFQNIQGSLNLDKTQDTLAFDLSGISKQRDVQGSFSAQGQMPIHVSLLRSFSLTAKATSLPVRGLDQLLALKDPSYQDLLFELIGPKLDLSITAKASKDIAFATVNIASQKLQAHLETRSSKDAVYLTSPGTVDLQINPDFADKFFGHIAALNGYSLSEPANAQIVLKELNLPLVNEEVDFQNLHFIASADLSSLAISDKELVNLFTLRDLHFDLSSAHLKDGLMLSMDANTDIGALNITSAKFQVNNNLTLLEPVVVGFTPSDAFSTPLIPKISDVELDLQSLQLPLKGSDDTVIQAELKIPFLTLRPSFANANIPIQNFDCKIDASNLNAISFQIQSSLLNANLVASMQQKLLKVVDRTLVQIEVTNQLLQALSLNTNAPVSLLQPAMLQLQIDPFSIDLTKLSSLAVNASANIRQLNLQSDDKQLILENTTLNASVDGNKSRASLDLQSTMKSGGSLEMSVALNQFSLMQGFDPASSTLSLSIDLTDFPTALLQTLDKSAMLQPLIGPTLNLHVAGNVSPKNQSLRVNADSTLMQMSGSFVVVNRMLQMNPKDPLKISCTLTEAGYNAITTPQNPFSLKEPSSLNLSLSRLSLPLVYTPSSKIPSLSSNLANVQLVGSLQVDNFSVLEKKTQNTVAINSLNLNIEKASKNEPILFSVEGAVQSQSAKQAASQKGGEISISGKIDKIFAENGQMDLSHLYTDITAEVADFPAMTLDALFQIAAQSSFPFATVFGNTINATASAQLQDFSGPLHLNVNSQNTRASLTGRLQNGVLLLDDTVYAQLTLTPDLSKLLISEVNPLRITALTSNNPITFEIKPQGFSLPLSPFIMENVNIPNMRIELGQITCHNEGNINVTLGLLRSKQLSKDKDLKLWFAPIDVHIKQGIVDCERTEVLVANTFEIAIWGTVDLVKSYVDMVLGLTKQCIETAFGIKGLPDNYVLQLPMKGPTDDVEINTSKATAKIALLLAWQQKAISGAVKGPAGAILNDVLGKVATLPDSDSKAPPAKHPFPWEKQGAQIEKSNYAPEKIYSKKRRIKKGDKPLKQLLKILKP